MDIGYSCRFAWSLLRRSPVPFLQAQRIRVQDGDDGLELIIDETFGKQTNVNVNKCIYNWLHFTGWIHIIYTEVFSAKAMIMIVMIIMIMMMRMNMYCICIHIHLSKYTVGRKTYSVVSPCWHGIIGHYRRFQVSPWLIWSQHISFSYYKWKKYKRWSQDNWRRISFFKHVFLVANFWCSYGFCAIFAGWWPLNHMSSTWLKSWFSLQIGSSSQLDTKPRTVASCDRWVPTTGPPFSRRGEWQVWAAKFLPRGASFGYQWQVSVMHRFVAMGFFHISPGFVDFHPRHRTGICITSIHSRSAMYWTTERVLARFEFGRQDVISIHIHWPNMLIQHNYGTWRTLMSHDQNIRNR